MNDREDRLRWKEIDSRLVKRCGIFDLYESKRKAKNHKEGIFHLLDAPDWANVVPVLRDEQGRSCFLMVRQYRHGISRITLEFPAGLIEAGEEPEAAAKRELLEETGYGSGRLEPIGTINPNPAFMNNKVYTVLAEGAVPKHSQQFDEHEYVELAEKDLDVVDAEMGSGEFDNGVMMTALLFYKRYLEAEKKEGLKKG